MHTIFHLVSSLPLFFLSISRLALYIPKPTKTIIEQKYAYDTNRLIHFTVKTVQISNPRLGAYSLNRHTRVVAWPSLGHFRVEMAPNHAICTWSFGFNFPHPQFWPGDIASEI
ncbi:unnamed protein product [Kuraishia capsulata CBS 1993]|uniref:Uncharacterized protein n=1 Tax=Kuraishia capsulata CBS 1993 TaxID=1382522 RepID=W6MRQ1_9ASCO|nr:uncharacterized protein KUCA_T00003907001 [Kuraishia capsulata CBS 1993]CDK27927.1 unnamed protein product [Kuraishia capsulata CBS 1993]